MLNFLTFKLYTILKFVHNLFINWDIVLKILLCPFGTSGLRSLPLTLTTYPEFPTGFTEPRSRFRWFGPAFSLYEIFNFRCGSPLQSYAELIPNLQHRTPPTANGVLLTPKEPKPPLRGNFFTPSDTRKRIQRTDGLSRNRIEPLNRKDIQPVQNLQRD